MSSQRAPEPECAADARALPLFLAAAGAAALATYLLQRRRPPERVRPDPAACALARAWLAVDPDPATRADVRAWLAAYLADPAAPSRLPDALDPASRLRFGTAGLRAAQGAGYDRLNALVVVAVAQAVAKVARVRGRPVVVGYDARRNSRKYAIVVADVLRHAGAHVLLFSRPVPTPFVAYAVRRERCAVGICVTASHNPPQDNGIKVFWSDGIQIRPHVATRIEKAVKECSRPLKTYALTDDQLGPITDPFEHISAAYYADIARLCMRRHQNPQSPPLVYTACHGVGYPYVVDIFKHFALPPPIPCEEQCHPDPSFPTLPFPNPEEKGALDLAIATARRTGARVVLANDPDADRLGVAEISNTGAVRIFTGDEIAVLFADYLTTMRKDEDMSQYAMVASTVSSKVLASMAKSRGFVFRAGLTGFKWLNKEALNLEEEGKTVLLTYEEAIGYNITRNVVRDKDGVSGAAVFAELAALLYESGKTLEARLNEVLLECGVHISLNGYLRLAEKSPSPATIFEQARTRGLPKALGKATVKSIRDLTYGTDSGEANGKARLPADSASQFVTFRCCRDDTSEEDCPLIIHIRGSGTEPKIKFYAELRCTPEDEADGSARIFLRDAVEDAISKVLQPDVNSLTRK